MSKQKTAEFLVDCLENIPPQRGEVKAVVNTAIAGLTRIAEGGEWPEDEALDAVEAAYWTEYWDADAANAAYWAANWAAYWAAAEADWAADWAARAHPDPDAERARQAIVREQLGLNTKGA